MVLLALACTCLFMTLAHRLAVSLPLTERSVIRHVPVREKIVALTFDDSPDARFTPAILQMLNEHGAKATFFVIGSQLRQNPQIARDIVRGGHALGNHTARHPSSLLNTDPSVVASEVRDCGAAIHQITGQNVRLFRPPKGYLDRNVSGIARRMGYTTVLWTVSGNNRNAPHPRDMADRVIRRVRPGAIILLHDGRYPSRWKDVQAARLIVEDLQKEGYTFVTVPELLAKRR